MGARVTANRCGMLSGEPPLDPPEYLTDDELDELDRRAERRAEWIDTMREFRSERE